MNFPTTPLVDDFNRADENPLSQGGAWNRDQFGIDPTLKVVSNQVVAVGANLSSRVRGAVTRLGNNHEVWGTVVDCSSAGAWVGVCYRVSDAGGLQSCYAMVAKKDTAQLSLNRRAGSPVTELITFTPATFTPPFQIGARVRENVHEGFYNDGSGWVKVMEVIDSTFPTGGTLGAWVRRASGSALDDFGGGNIFQGQIIRHHRASSVSS